MKQTALFSALLGLLLTAACKKDSCIEGTVTDVKTGKPIAGVSLSLSYTFSQEGSYRTGGGSAETDGSGSFSFTADQGDYVVWGIRVSYAIMKGYSSVFSSKTEENKGCDHLDIKMLPLDGMLKLTILNETGMHNSLFAEVFIPCEYALDPSEGSHRNGLSPLMLQKGKSHTRVIGSCIGDTIPIRWRFSESGPWFRTDSVFIKTADTTFFKIVY